MEANNIQLKMDTGLLKGLERMPAPFCDLHERVGVILLKDGTVTCGLTEPEGGSIAGFADRLVNGPALAKYLDGRGRELLTTVLRERIEQNAEGRWLFSLKGVEAARQLAKELLELPLMRELSFDEWLGDRPLSQIFAGEPMFLYAPLADDWNLNSALWHLGHAEGVAVPAGGYEWAVEHALWRFVEQPHKLGSEEVQDLWELGLISREECRDWAWEFGSPKLAERVERRMREWAERPNSWRDCRPVKPQPATGAAGLGVCGEAQG